MHIKILGASACAGHPGQTTSFLLGSDTLLDCGSGCGNLSSEEMLAVRRVLLSHSHLDHCGFLPLLAGAHACHNGSGLDVHALPETLDALQTHLFNGLLWPEFTRMPSPDSPWLRFHPLEVGDSVAITEGMATALPAQHSVPALGWLIEGPWRALAYSGDSGPCPAFWHWVSNVPSLTDVICEITYSDERQHEASRFGHLTPGQLAPLLGQLPANVHLWVSHIDPGSRDQLLAQMQHCMPAGLHVCPLKEGTLIEL